MSLRRKSLPFFQLLLLTLLALTPRAQETYQAKPLPSGPEANTWSTVHELRHQFWLEHIGAAAPPPEGASAEAAQDRFTLIDGLAAVLAGKRLSQASHPRMQAAAVRLLDEGQDEAWVRLAAAEALRHEGRLDAARPHYTKAAQLANDPTTDRLMQYLVCSSLSEFYVDDRSQSDFAEALNQARIHLLKLVNDPRFVKGIGPRIYLSQFHRMLGSNATEKDGVAITQLQQLAAKPHYAVLTLRAEHHSALAWLARGRGTASSIGRNDMETFRRELNTALTCAEEACKVGPHFPEAPALMLRILGTGGETELLRQWLDRSVAAQFDYITAYDTFLHYQQPRWGGSHEVQWQFGLECLATGRFDTKVPEQFRTAMRQIAKDMRDPHSFWGRPEVQKCLEQLDAGNLAAASSPSAKLTALTQRMASLVLGNQASTAARIYQENGNRIDSKALAVFPLQEAWLLGALRPHLDDYEPMPVVGLRELAVAPTVDPDRKSSLQGKENTPTHADLSAQRKTWLGDVFVNAYQKHGLGDERWDEIAPRFLRDVGAWLGSGPKGDIAERAIELQQMDCSDPLVQYAIVRVLVDNPAEERLRRMQRLIGNLTRRYPDLIGLWAKNHIWNLAKELGIGGAGNALVPELRQHLVAAAANPVVHGANARHYLWSLWGEQQFAWTGIDMMNEEMTAEIRQLPGVEPWLAQVVTGLCLVGRLRQGKGTPEQLAESLREADKLLQQAHTAHPERPEAAVGMIFVSMLQAPGAGDSPRQWFDRAIAAQFDFLPAYDAMLEALRPARGGSLQEMRNFASECLATKRFETRIPLQFVRGLVRIQKEVQTPRSVWASTGIAEQLEDLLTGYSEHPQSPYSAAGLMEARCLMAWLGGRYQDALTAYERSGKKLTHAWAEYLVIEDLAAVELDLAAFARKRGN